MIQQMRVERKLEFVGVAKQKANIFGNPCFDKVVFYDDFLGDALDARWAPSGDNGGTEAITVGTGGTVTLTTGGTDHDRSILAHELNWYANKACVIEARIKVNAITAVAINMGFSDAKTEANDLIPFMISVTTVTDTASNAVCFVFDTDADSDVWYMCNTIANTQTGTSTAIAPVADTYETFRVELDILGNATFYRNGIAVGYKALAVTITTALTPIFAVIEHGTSARVLTVDYVYCWQNRS